MKTIASKPFGSTTKERWFVYHANQRFFVLWVCHNSEDAIGTLSPSEHPLVHTDRGCHYRWPGWIARMKTTGLTRSMSRKGCSPDNAVCEGFFGRLKNEMFYRRSWVGMSIDDFINEINGYIKWYNTNKLSSHWAIEPGRVQT